MDLANRCNIKELGLEKIFFLVEFHFYLNASLNVHSLLWKTYKSKVNIDVKMIKLKTILLKDEDRATLFCFK